MYQWTRGPKGTPASEEAWEAWESAHANRGVKTCPPPKPRQEEELKGFIWHSPTCEACKAALAPSTTAKPRLDPQAVSSSSGSSAAPTSRSSTSSSRPPPPPPPPGPPPGSSSRGSTTSSPTSPSSTSPASSPRGGYASPQTSQAPRSSPPTTSLSTTQGIPFSTIRLGSMVFRNAHFDYHTGSCNEVSEDQCSIKVYRRPLHPTRTDPLSVHSELDVASRLPPHPYLCKVFGACLRPVQGGYQLHIVQEYVPSRMPLPSEGGGGGGGRVAPPSKPLMQRRLQQMHQVCLALNALHTHTPNTLVHGDVRTSSIFLLNDGTAKLDAWGIGRVHRACAPEDDEAGSGGGDGDVAYRAPELLAGARGVRGASFRTTKSDMYALGVTLWEVLTGCEAYSEGGEGSSEALVQRIVHGLRPSLEALPREFPNSIKTLCQSLWHPNPLSRPTAKVAAAALEKALEVCGGGGGAATQADSRARSLWASNSGSSGSSGSGSGGSGSYGGSPSSSRALILYNEDEEDLPFSPQVAEASYSSKFANSMGGLSEDSPRVTITPVHFANPPEWDFSREPTPPELDRLLHPLHPSKAGNVVASVVVPFYSEGGYALRRGLEALALQVKDMKHFHAMVHGTPPQALPELHVFAIADGWKRGDTPILSDSMWADILELFGPTFPADTLVDYLEGKEGEGGAGDLPDHVLVQFAVPAREAGGGSGHFLHPISLDCQWAASMVARSKPPKGETAAELKLAQRRAAEAAAGGGGGGGRGGNEGGWGSSMLFGKGGGGGTHPTPGAVPTFSKRKGGYSDPAASPLLGQQQQQQQPYSSGAPSGASVGSWSSKGGGKLPIYFTLMIKRQNAKKHHSHLWFFEAFAPLTARRTGPSHKYMFATDCGTLYAPYLLTELMLHMEKNPRAAACTGHQRIMAKEDQLDPGDPEAESWSAAALRSIQAFDFESGLCTFNGCHALAGFLPVVPGPCGLFRASNVTPGILARVRAICGSQPSEDGLVVANLKIAEDRILSYLLVLVEGPGGRTAETHWVPSTTFFFESEGTLKEFVLQRRRWLNGTTAGYMWLVGTPELWRGVSSCSLTALNVLVLSCTQLFVFFIVFLMPGLLIVTGFLAWSGLGLLLTVAGAGSSARHFAATLSYSYVFFSCTSLILHVYFARAGATNFTPWVWYFRVVLHGTTMAVTLLTTLGVLLLASFASSNFQAALQEGLDADSAASDVNDARMAGALGIIYTTTPFFLSMMHSSESFAMMVNTYPTFFFFAPTILADFYSYSVARFDDISWGTKAVSSAGKSAAGSLATKKAERSRRRGEGEEEGGGSSSSSSSSRRGGYEPPSRKAALQRALRASNNQEASNATTTMASIVQILLCVFVACVNAYMSSVSHYLLYFGLMLSFVGYVIMGFSMTYFVGRAACGCWGARPSLSQRLNATFVFTGWLCILVSMVLVAVPALGLQVIGGVVFIGTYAILMVCSIPHFLSSPSNQLVTEL